jgi:hypothetical protein
MLDLLGESRKQATGDFFKYLLQLVARGSVPIVATVLAHRQRVGLG